MLVKNKYQLKSVQSKNVLLHEKDITVEVVVSIGVVVTVVVVSIGRVVVTAVVSSSVDCCAVSLRNNVIINSATLTAT